MLACCLSFVGISSFMEIIGKALKVADQSLHIIVGAIALILQLSDLFRNQLELDMKLVLQFEQLVRK